MTRASRWAWVAVTLASGLLASARAESPARGSEIAHVRAEGETLERVAGDYYGDSGFADLIRRHNEALGADAHARTVRIPTARVHSVGDGDTWASLAQTYWGDPALGPTLARQLGAEPDAPLESGASLQIPGLVEWRLRRGETLAQVSRTLYGTADRAGEIAALSGIANPNRLGVGARVRAPFLVHARVHKDPAATPPVPPAPPQPETGVAKGPEAAVVPTDLRGDPPSEPAQVATSPPLLEPPASALSPEDRQALRIGVNGYLEGSYESALEQLESVRASVLARGSDAERAQLLHHLVLLYVAFDRPDDACGPHLALQRIDPAQSLDPDQVSPKVRVAVERCREP
jgi:hypothetical protein